MADRQAVAPTGVPHRKTATRCAGYQAGGEGIAGNQIGGTGMRRWFEEWALWRAYRFLAYVRRGTGPQDVNVDAKLNVAQDAIVEVLATKYGPTN